MWHRLVSSLVLLASPLAWAAGPTITSVSGASGYNLTGTITVFGGLAGNVCSGTDIYSTCDSCANVSCGTAPLCACNKNRIYDGLYVKLFLKLDGATGQGRVRSADGTQLINIQTLNNGGSYVDINWTDICSRANNGSGGTGTGTNCAGIASANNTTTLKVWIDTNNNDTIDNNEAATDVQFRMIAPAAGAWDVYGSTAEGVDSFLPYPGDGKIYIEQLHSSSGFPNLSYGSKATALRVFISDVNMDDATAASGFEPQDVKIVEDGTTVERPIVDGLDNDKLYFFRIALVDEASNLVQHYPAASGLDASCTTNPGTSSCPFSATPSEVLGLLSKDMNCFIATAAYGSNLEPKLNVFRQFRHRFLLPNTWGLDFVKAYYHYGPYAARWISDKPAARAIVRGALYPAYGFSYLALEIGFAQALAVSASLLLALAAAISFALRRITRHV